MSTESNRTGCLMGGFSVIVAVAGALLRAIALLLAFLYKVLFEGFNYQQIANKSGFVLFWTTAVIFGLAGASIMASTQSLSDNETPASVVVTVVVTRLAQVEVTPGLVSANQAPMSDTPAPTFTPMPTATETETATPTPGPETVTAAAVSSQIAATQATATAAAEVEQRATRQAVSRTESAITAVARTEYARAHPSSTPQPTYLPIAARIYAGIKVYNGVGAQKAYAFEVLGGSENCQSINRGIYVLYPDGTREWKDRDYIIGSGFFFVREDDPALKKYEWYEYSGCP